MQALRAYVAAGGGLVASLDTSLCNEFGDVREDFGLGDLLGVRRSKQQPGTATATAAELDVNFAKNLDDNYWLKRRGIYDLRLPVDGPLEEPRLRRYIGADSVTFKGDAVAVETTDGAQSAAAISTQPADKAVKLPAVVLRQHGKGRVAYLPAGIDAAYYFYPYPYQRLLLKQAITWAAGEKPPIEVAAPMCVQMTAMRQQYEGKERLLIHLFNDVNTTAFHALPNDDVPLREETLPVHDIRVSLRGYKIAAATQQPENKSLPLATSGDTAELTVPRLDVHSILVLDLQ
jgi:hypothetical protein